MIMRDRKRKSNESNREVKTENKRVRKSGCGCKRAKKKKEEV
jgi:hypothetical protein